MGRESLILRVAKIIDEELEIAETAILEGGLLGVGLASQICGVSRQYMNRISKMENHPIQSWAIGGQIFFSAIDCLHYRNERRRAANLAKRMKQVKTKPV